LEKDKLMEKKTKQAIYKMSGNPNPGSDEAIRLGCRCPVMDNEYGRGYMGVEGVFVYSENCSIHGGELKKNKKEKKMNKKATPKEKEMKAQKAVDKMLGINKLYITLSSPVGLVKGDRVCVIGNVGENGEIVAGRIEVTRSFDNVPFSGPQVGGLIKS
jgi:hypothetical protein